MLAKLCRAGLLANPCKCQLEAQYFGYCIGQGLLKLQKSKVEVVRSYPCPTTKHLVYVLLGLVGYYRHFVLNFSSLPFLLSDLTRKGELENVWRMKETKLALQCLKIVLRSSPVLRNPDISLPFLVHTDDSETALGAVFSQDYNGEEHPIMFSSRKITPAKWCYAAND